MKKRSAYKKVQENTNSCSWFDNENARLIILCSVFGVFGAHKFAQGKKGQGWLFILLDLTVIGILVAAIWALIDLVFLTVNKTNKPGNIILGSAFIMCNLCGFIPEITNIYTESSGPTITKIEKTDVKENKTTQIDEEKTDSYELVCYGLNTKKFTKDMFIKLGIDGKNAVIITKEQNISLTNQTGNNAFAEKAIYQGWINYNNMTENTIDSKDFVSLTISRNKFDYPDFNIQGKLNGVYDEYYCSVKHEKYITSNGEILEK